MRIQDSQVAMRAAHAEQRQLRVERELRVSVAAPPPAAPVAAADAAAPDPATADPEIRYLQLLIEMLSGR